MEAGRPTGNSWLPGKAAPSPRTQLELEANGLDYPAEASWLGPSGIVRATGSEELLILGVSRDIAGGLLRGARREKPNDGGQANHHDDDRADEACSWQEGGEEDGQGDRADDDDGDRTHAAGWFPEPVGRKRPQS